MQSASYESCTATKTISVVDWAMESHRIANDCAYTFSEDRMLGAEYSKINVAVVDQQLTKAGVRLAKVLNEAFGKE